MHQLEVDEMLDAWVINLYSNSWQKSYDAYDKLFKIDKKMRYVIWYRQLSSWRNGLCPPY
ncbi:hypothetical protein BBBOND_0105840 [Babesia bigemina]|uniref:Uncharacterized protein n=1 Tax=Babesia bigemina TaxID=5866 RepID=A0A061D985_BABBI|nr:hypothetical protein BBBOND_0105840 [Babesia bigemina]CDR94275.1 hypothetical protein BBBOND_0105840 [Babesia bigemina]|eukprot:XP_012766461.1 hypothetical protein BBBOND_0105840 [Babesia bigemina]